MYMTTPINGIGYIGDSLTYQAGSTAPYDSLIAAGWTNVIVNGVTGRSITGGNVTPTTDDVLSGWKTQGFNPRLWITPLGANNLGATDSQWTSMINTFLDKIQSFNGSHVVYWPCLGLRLDKNDSRVTRFLSVMRAIPQRPGLTVKPLDWSSYIHNGRDETGLWNLSDTTGRHMTFAGYKIRNQYITSQVQAELLY